MTNWYYNDPDKANRIPSLGVKTDGTVTPDNTLTEKLISTEVDPNKWGVKLASGAQKICTRHQ